MAAAARSATAAASFPFPPDRMLRWGAICAAGVVFDLVPALAAVAICCGGVAAMNWLVFTSLKGRA